MCNLDAKAGASYEKLITVQGIDKELVRNLLCKIRTKLTGSVVHDFGTIPVKQDSTALLSATPSQTSRWKLGKAEMDIAVVTTDGHIWPSQTLELEITRFVSGA